ncbi:hypothetical protein HYFRA_00012958 [Hymenoscyphus fraxineus]|uniref:Uncharacterized protein n=1 Tax=Hymenoscyphus fraxineus TaxID=746836 RepID=A0A9N9L2Y9_9HELO|nr:hypothetical protein HYFRA_00012958 [Hymenoscyphus fraxineus]
MLLNFLLVASLLSSASSVPVAAPQEDPAPFPDDGIYRWKVTGWDAECSASGCFYQFTLTGFEFKGAGGSFARPFKAFCKADEATSLNFTACELRDSGDSTRKVTARITSLPRSGVKNVQIQASYEFLDTSTLRQFSSTGTEATIDFNLATNPNAPRSFNIDNIIEETK